MGSKYGDPNFLESSFNIIINFIGWNVSDWSEIFQTSTRHVFFKKLSANKCWSLFKLNSNPMLINLRQMNAGIAMKLYKDWVECYNRRPWPVRRRLFLSLLSDVMRIAKERATSHMQCPPNVSRVKFGKFHLNPSNFTPLNKLCSSPLGPDA